MDLDGECTYGRFYLVKSAVPSTPSLDVAASTTVDCCGDFSLKVLADTEDDDEFKNDRTTFHKYYNSLVVDTALMELHKWNGSEYEKVADLDNDDYGTYYQYGFFTNDASESFVGYEVDWRLVLDEFEAGSYKIKLNVHTVLDEEFSVYSDEYCLKKYSAARANGTMKIEYYLNGIIGDSNNDEIVRDYGTLNWYNSVRIPGWFGFPKSEYSKEYTQYDTGSREWVKDEQEPEFLMTVKRVSAIVHNIMRTDVAQADTVLVTDYNSNNPETWIQKSVQLTGGYSPEWHIMKSELAGVNLKFRQRINNLRKNRQ